MHAVEWYIKQFHKEKTVNNKSSPLQIPSDQDPKRSIKTHCKGSAYSKHLCNVSNDVHPSEGDHLDLNPALMRLYPSKSSPA